MHTAQAGSLPDRPQAVQGELPAQEDQEGNGTTTQKQRMRHVESDIQIACVRWFRYRFPRYARLLFAVPNGGARNAVTGAILKAEGVVPGVADLLLLVPRNGYHGLAIEMKTRTGRQSDSQREWQQEVEAQGYRYVVCHSFDDFRNAVDEYLIDGKG